MHRAILLLLFFLSGVAALIYEVLWLKELARLFGATAPAAATTLAVFFFGLSAGAIVWGRSSARVRNPLRAYAVLEVAIALSAVLYFLLLELYYAIYSPLFRAVGDQPGLFLLAKFLLAAVILFPAAFFMGGTLPMMGQLLVRRADELGRQATLLYAVNTIGAATGTLLAGFWLPAALGFFRSYWVAIAINILIAGIAFAYRAPLPPAKAPLKKPQTKREQPLPRGSVALPRLWILAFASGLATLGLEVLWTRMYAQVLQNSVYTFAIILTVFLASLAFGSALANALCRLRASPRTILYSLLVVSGTLVALTPHWFYHHTSGLDLVGARLGFSNYILSSFGNVALVLLLPGLAIGTLFPFLMRLAEKWMVSAGRTLGQLASINTVGAITGSLAAGFILLQWIGLWHGIWLIGLLYFLLALLVLPDRSRLLPLVPPAVGMVLIGGAWSQSDLGTVSVMPAKNEQVLEVVEGSHATVAVLSEDGNLRIKVNNSYTFGGTDPPTLELHRLQSRIPLSIHPTPKSVFYLGMGTGITAGAGLDHPIERLTVCELLPEVVKASRRRFRPYVNGLFEDPRVAVRMEDGRAYLLGTDDRYDVVIAELFLPWKAGTGSLYTREHFEAVRSRLRPGGLFAQWLPMAQLSELEFGIIARTMLEVFPQVTVWRAGFSITTPSVALIGQTEVAPLDNQAFTANIAAVNVTRRGKTTRQSPFDHFPHMSYAGNLTAARSLFAEAPITTDDRPLIEYLSPITQRNHWARRTSMLQQFDLTRLYASLFQALPPAQDPYLSKLNQTEQNHVLAGAVFHNYGTLQHAGRTQEAQAEQETFQRLLGDSPSP